MVRNFFKVVSKEAKENQTHGEEFQSGALQMLSQWTLGETL